MIFINKCERSDEKKQKIAKIDEICVVVEIRKKLQELEKDFFNSYYSEWLRQIVCIQYIENSTRIIVDFEYCTSCEITDKLWKKFKVIRVISSECSPENVITNEFGQPISDRIIR